MELPKPSLRSAFSGANRAQQVLRILVKHGLSELVSELRLAPWLKAAAKTRSEGAEQDTGSSIPSRARSALEELGPTFVKLGQFLSTRPDLLPAEWIDELSLLQDHVQFVAWEEIDEILERGFGDRSEQLFRTIESEPVAAGSIAQVHAAELMDGTKVVLKVLRPGIRSVIEADIDVLELLASFAERHAGNLGFDPLEVVAEFAEDRRAELDLMREGKATARLRTFFSDDEEVVFPRVYWDGTTTSILCLERLEGRPLSEVDFEALPESRRESILRIGTRAVFRQCFDLGFFHADPHPGNLFLLDASSSTGDRLAFLDCGIAGRLERNDAGLLADLVVGLLGGDVDRTLKAAIELTDADPELVSNRQLRRNVADIILDTEAGRLESIDVAMLLRRFFAALRRHRVRCPSDLLRLIKALTTIEAVAASIDERFDVVGELRKEVERLIVRRRGPAAVLRRTFDAAGDYADLLEELPQDLRRLGTRLAQGPFSISLAHSGLERLTSVLEYASRNLAFAILVASTVVGSAILVLADPSSPAGLLTKIAIGGFVVAGAMAILLALHHYRFREPK